MVFYKTTNKLQHHGILGQEWGVRNGPPYPLKGGDYSKQEQKEIFEEREKNKNSIYNKKHFDQVVSTNDTLLTLSHDKERTKNTDMFYAAYKPIDKLKYTAYFNNPKPRVLYNEKGQKIGTGVCFKYRINNKVKDEMKVASEDSGANAFKSLYEKDRDFYNYVTDENRMQAAFVKSKYKYEGFREARDALEKIRNGDRPSEEDLNKVYRMYNYTIPFDGKGNERAKNDSVRQRAKFFNELKKDGYGAVLDTNDAIYNNFKASSPVIVFDIDGIVPESVKNTRLSTIIGSSIAYSGRKIFGG